jgi:hypothetical protein
MFASALEGFLTNPSGLHRAIREAVRIDRRVETPAKELIQLISTIGQGRAPRVQTHLRGRQNGRIPPTGSRRISRVRQSGR